MDNGLQCWNRIILIWIRLQIWPKIEENSNFVLHSKIRYSKLWFYFVIISILFIYINQKSNLFLKIILCSYIFGHFFRYLDLFRSHCPISRYGYRSGSGQRIWIHSTEFSDWLDFSDFFGCCKVVFVRTEELIEIYIYIFRQNGIYEPGCKEGALRLRAPQRTDQGVRGHWRWSHGGGHCPG